MTPLRLNHFTSSSKKIRVNCVNEIQKIIIQKININADARDIQKKLIDNEIQLEKEISRTLYDYIVLERATKRAELTNILGDFQNEYYSTLLKISYQLAPKIESNGSGGWARFFPRKHIDKSNYLFHPLQHIVVIHKLYYNLKTFASHQEIFEIDYTNQSYLERYKYTILEFLSNLKKTLEDLYQFSIKHDLMIELKLPDDVTQFARKTDDIVIHYGKSKNISNREAAKEIDRIILSNTNENFFRREGKSKSGFDFYMYMKGGGRVGKTHTELISTVLSRRIIKELVLDKINIVIDKTKFEDYIYENIILISKMSPEKVFTEIQKSKVKYFDKDLI